MSWYRHGDERAEQAAQARRDVLRGPVPQSGSGYGEPAVERSLKRAFSGVTIVLVLMVLLLLAASGYYAQYSGALRWILYGLVVGAVGVVAVRALGRSVRDPGRPALPPSPPPIGGELTSLRTTLGRATDGLAYSQILFEERMRDAFLDKVRVTRAVSEDAMLAATRNPMALHGLVGDAELEAFVLESVRDARSYPSRVARPSKKADFARRAAVTLARIEAWQ